MPKIQVSITVEGSAFDLGKQAGFLVAALVQKKPLAEIAAQELIQVQQIAKDIGDFSADLKEDKAAFIEGAVLGLKEGLNPLFAPAVV